MCGYLSNLPLSGCSHLFPISLDIIIILQSLEQRWSGRTLHRAANCRSIEVTVGCEDGDCKHKHDVLLRNTPPKRGYHGNHTVQKSICCVASQKHTGQN